MIMHRHIIIPDASKDERLLQQVYQIQSKLDTEDIKSLIFLLEDDIELALKQLQRNCMPVLDSSPFRIGNSFPLQEGFLVEWVKAVKACSLNSQRRKVLEALLIMKNYRCLKFMGENKSDKSMMIKFYPNIHDFSVEVDCLRKFLFLMLEDLFKDECDGLINYLKEDLMQRNIKFPSNSPRCGVPVEYFLLLHISEGILTSKSHNSKMDLTSLSKSLKKIGKLEWVSRVKMFQDFMNSKDSVETILPERKFNLDVTSPGEILIINQVEFKGVKDDRDGSTKDARRLCETFKLFNFKCTTVHNLTQRDMYNTIKSSIQEFCERDRLPNSVRCFVLAILSHGDENGVYGVDGGILVVEEILNLLRSELLQGMPRLVICQSCRGDSQVALVNGRTMRITTDTAGSCLTDLFVYSSCVKGFSAYRSPSFGSFFIYTLCKVLLLHGSSKDFLHLTHEINHELTLTEIHINDVQVKMVAELQGTATKLLYFPNIKHEEREQLLKKWETENYDTDKMRKLDGNDKLSKELE